MRIWWWEDFLHQKKGLSPNPTFNFFFITICCWLMIFFFFFFLFLKWKVDLDWMSLWGYKESYSCQTLTSWTGGGRWWWRRRWWFMLGWASEYYAFAHYNQNKRHGKLYQNTRKYWVQIVVIGGEIQKSFPTYWFMYQTCIFSKSYEKRLYGCN